MYRQCTLQKKDRFQTKWIPVQHAILGKYLTLKEDKEWEDGWKVIKVDAVKTADMIETLEDQHRRVGPSLKPGGRIRDKK